MIKNQEFDPYAYVIHIEHVSVEGDKYFKTSIFELPDVEVYESTAAAAHQAIIDCIVDLHAAATADGRQFPAPDKVESDDYSGRVTLRMGKSLHRRIGFQAKKNGNTLNAEIVSQLSESSAIQDLTTNLISQVKQEIRELAKASTTAKSMSAFDPNALGFADKPAVHPIAVGAGGNGCIVDISSYIRDRQVGCPYSSTTTANTSEPAYG